MSFAGVSSDEPRPDPAEVGAWRWISVGAVRRALEYRRIFYTLVSADR